MAKNRFILDNCVLCLFINSIVFLIPIIYFYINLIPQKTSFDNPDKIYIFNAELNKSIKNVVKTIVKSQIYGILGLCLIFIIFVTTIIKIIILCKATKNKSIDEKLIKSQISI